MQIRELKTLGELIEIKHGFAFSGEHIVSDEQDRILITPGHFEIGGGFRHNHKKFFNSYNYRDGYELEPGELIVTMTDLSNSGDTLGYAAVVPNISGKILLHNQRIGKVILKTKEIDIGFCHYLLRSAPYRHHVLATCTGSTVKHTSPSKILDYKFSLPPIAEQKAIAHILGALDDKIENNRRMNETLEEMARAIFKSWFVDFNPVCAKMEGRPTGFSDDISDLFPNELVDSEIGQIPKGWSIAELSDLADITMGQSPPGDTYNDNQVGLPFYQGSTDFGFRFPSIRKFCSDPRRLAETDDVLLSVRAPVGDLNRAKMQCCIGRGLASIRSKTKHSSWIFYRCSFLKEYFDTFNSEGTVFGSVNGRDLKAIKSVNPPERIFDSYERIVSPMDKFIRVKTDEIDTLAELRDTLLPKLISGEIRVADAKRKKEAL